VLREGRIVVDGPKGEVLTTEMLQNVFGLPVELAQRDGYYHLW